MLAADNPGQGLPAGPWILAPSLVVGYEHSDNVFYESESAPPVSDYSLVVEPGIVATLPFRNSYLDLSYRASWYDYGYAFEEANLGQDLAAHLSLLFSTSDRLTFSGDRIFGVSNTEEFDPGGEVLYRGNEYALDDVSVKLEREVSGRRGYSLNLAWTKLDFEANEEVSFFDYEGWYGEAEYREPLRPNLWLTAGYRGSSYDHFCHLVDSLGNPCVDTSEPFRQEDSQTASLGVRGLLSGKQPFWLQAGWMEFRYLTTSQRTFRGLTADANLTFPIGGGSSLRIGGMRRPFPSFYLNSDFYLMERIDTQFEHRWERGSTIGVRASAWSTSYSDAIPPGFVGEGIVRKDEYLQGEVYATVSLVERFGLTFSASRQRRTSNVPNEDYFRNAYFAGLSYGFF